MNTSLRFVRIFQPRFADLVESGAKLQTIRITPKRMPKEGDIISLRAWSGKPYRSKQRVLSEATITKVAPILIHYAAAIIGEPHYRHIVASHLLEEFAKEDGFTSWSDLLDWFSGTHGIPFEGILICWDNRTCSCHLDSEMGMSMGDVKITQLSNGTWEAIFGSEVQGECRGAGATKDEALSALAKNRRALSESIWY